MANRIPPSLNWLIDKRARIAGELEKTRRSLRNARALLGELQELEAKLAAIDTTLELHEIKVDVSLVKPIYSKHLRLKIPYGELTKSILICIKLHAPGSKVSKSKIIDFVIARHFASDADESTYGQIAESISRRLNCLYHEGYLERHHSPTTRDYGLWSLKESFLG